MKGWICLLLLVACSAGDDVGNGTRGLCAEGGQLNACPPAERTPQAACWRLVDCGAIPAVRNDNDDARDWDDCVEQIEGMRDTAENLVIACIASSTCDQLKFDTDRCFSYGAF